MAYIVNISETAAITLNLAQGRVQLEPKGYCVLSSIDIEQAKQNYNSKELGLCVVETEQELNLILGKQTATFAADIKPENLVLAPDMETIPDPGFIPSVQETDVAEETDDSDEDETSENSINEEDNEEDNEKDNNNGKDEEELSEEAKAKRKLINTIEAYRAADNLNGLKELATKLNIPYMYNISFDKLASKVLLHLEEK